jgi:hypothetical protein
MFVHRGLSESSIQTLRAVTFFLLEILKKSISFILYWLLGDPDTVRSGSGGVAACFLRTRADGKCHSEKGAKIIHSVSSQ